MTSAHLHSEPEIAVVGCGRWLRRDDQSGLLAAEFLETSLAPKCLVVGTEAPATDIPNLLEGVRLLIIVDAARSADGHPPGSWARMDYWTHKDHLAQRCRTDTHALSVDLALSLAEAMGTLPQDTWIYAIAAEDCGYGEDVTPAVAKAITEVTACIETDIADYLSGKEVCHA